MPDGRINRALDQGRELRERVPELGSEIKSRGSDLRERVPELGSEIKSRGSDLRERVPELGSEIKSRGSDLRERVRREELARKYRKMDVSWARCGYARALRGALLSGVLGPAIDFYTRTTVSGREIFDGDLKPPVIFVSTHSSHLDTPQILRAMPRAWRTRTAVTAAADYFYKHRWSAYAVALLLNTVPIGRTGDGLGGGATDHIDRLLGERWNLMMFPEGTRSRDGSIGRVRSGAAVLAAQHGIPLVPIRVTGTHAAMPPGRFWPRRLPGRPFGRRHKIEIRFGEPIIAPSAEQRREVMARVLAFWEESDEGAAMPEHDVLIMHAALRAHERALQSS